MALLCWGCLLVINNNICLQAYLGEVRFNIVILASDYLLADLLLVIFPLTLVQSPYSQVFLLLYCYFTLLLRKSVLHRTMSSITAGSALLWASPYNSAGSPHFLGFSFQLCCSPVFTMASEWKFNFRLFGPNIQLSFGPKE